MTPNTKALVIWLFAIGGCILLALMASNEPTVSPLRTGRTCVEIAKRLMADNQHVTTADEQSDMKQCGEP
jgi:HAMP domain-containing protein